MVTEILEVERKYDVDADTEVPPLAGVIPGAVDGPAHEQELVATYLDTDDLRLRAARITLRHRKGGGDAGWHLKLPAGKARLEVHSSAAGPPGDVPEELASLVRSVVRRAPLVVVAQLRTKRTVHPLHDADGRILVELVDDYVEGVPEGGDPVRWREWEAELVAGDDRLLNAVEQRLLTSGAALSASGSKVSRVLGHRTGAVATRQTAPLRKGSTAAELVGRHLAEQVAELVARDPQVRRDEPDAVHKMRVATRRLRSALRTFRPLLDREHTDPVRDELRWLAGVLGAARDAEVLHARIQGLLDDQPDELVLGPVRKKVDDTLSGRYHTAHGRVVDELDGERYLILLETLADLGNAPPWLDAAGAAATDVIPALVRHADRRLARAVRTAQDSRDIAHDAALHEARKLAKRLRYACEAVAPGFGKPAVRLAAAATYLQEVLGEHQDSVVTRGALRELGAASSRAGQNGFTFGRLHGLEQARAELRAEEWRAVWKRTSRRKVRRWLAG